MKTSACSCVVAVLFFSATRLVCAQEPTIPDKAPPNELIGRWLEKTPRHEGNLVGYNVYCFSRQSEFLVVSKVRDEKTKEWVATTKLWGRAHGTLTGYVEATAPDALVFQVVVYAMAVLPIEMRYKVSGNTLVLSGDLFDPILNREVHCERVALLPGETAEEAAGFEKRIESGLNGPDFRRTFESAAHEMKDHPRDEEMIANFTEHRDDFETLRKMMQSDKELKRVDFDWTRPDDPASVGVSPERIELYRDLSRRLGLEHGVEAFGDSTKRVTFLASVRGASISGSSKSYVWLKSPPERGLEPAPVENLEVYANKLRDDRQKYFVRNQRAMSESADALRHIEGNWYLEYEDN